MMHHEKHKFTHNEDIDSIVLVFEKFLEDFNNDMQEQEYDIITTADFAGMDYWETSKAVNEKYYEARKNGKSLCFILTDDDYRSYKTGAVKDRGDIDSYVFKSSAFLQMSDKVIIRSEALGRDIIWKDRLKNDKHRKQFNGVFLSFRISNSKRECN
jgi:hypothetical protein